MTQEDKELLLRDLCTRLPYGVMCDIGLDHPVQLQRIFVDRLDGILLDFYEDSNDYQVYLSECKPYLIPLSSMNEEQEIIYGDLCYAIIRSLAQNVQAGLNELTDWLNKNHFDYQGLIEKGLAIKAPEGMYNQNL
jgi:hypothetical protein